MVKIVVASRLLVLNSFKFLLASIMYYARDTQKNCHLGSCLKNHVELVDVPISNTTWYNVGRTQTVCSIISKGSTRGTLFISGPYHFSCSCQNNRDKNKPIQIAPTITFIFLM